MTLSKKWSAELFSKLSGLEKPQMYLANAFVDTSGDGDDKKSLCFSGNPAAVCLTREEYSAEKMQMIAMEMNQSETAFLTNTTAHGGDVLLRWFTPAAEVDLCGHATLGTAAAVLHFTRESGSDFAAADATKMKFGTLNAGVLEVSQVNDDLTTPSNGIVCLEMDFPTTLVTKAEAPAGLLSSLGLEDPKLVVAVGKSIYDLVVEVNAEDTLLNMKPDFGALAKIGGRGILVTCRHTSGNFNRPGREVSFLSRGFFPAVGINEDPVTGSAHCALTPYWAEKLGQQEMWAYQASKRGGLLRVTHAGDRVQLKGYAYIFMEGSVNL